MKPEKSERVRRQCKINKLFWLGVRFLLISFTTKVEKLAQSKKLKVNKEKTITFDGRRRDKCRMKK